MRIAYLCKRHYMGKDVVLDRYARLYEIPFQLARFSVFPLAFDLTFVSFVDRQGEFARQQIVASISLGDFDDVAPAPQMFDVFSQNDFHDDLRRQG